MSGAKVAVVSSSSLLAPVLIGGVVVAGGGYLAKKGVEYGYLKVKYEKLKSDLKKYVQEIKYLENELKNEYNLNINSSAKLEKLSKETMQKYNNSIYEILASGETDRNNFIQKSSKIRAELNLVKLESQEIKKELLIYSSSIDKLEQSNEMKNKYEKIRNLYNSVNGVTTINQKKIFLTQLKDEILNYETKAFQLFMSKNSSEIKEDIFIEEHKSEKIKRDINIIIEKLKIIEPDYDFNFEISQESSRLELIKDEVKVTYAKTKKHKFLKDELLNLMRDIDNPDLNSKVISFTKQIEIDKNEYLELKDMIAEHKQKEEIKIENSLIADTVISGLKELGYDIVDEDIERLKDKEEVYIDIDNEYKLKVTFQNDNSYKIKFIKHVPDDNEPSQGEIQRDMEMMTKWCGDYDKLLEFLAKNGLGVEHKIKLEPDEDDIEYVVVADMKQSISKQKKQKTLIIKKD